jgi:hypothetical protein
MRKGLKLAPLEKNLFLYRRRPSVVATANSDPSGLNLMHLTLMASFVFLYTKFLAVLAPGS